MFSIMLYIDTCASVVCDGQYSESALLYIESIDTFFHHTTALMLPREDLRRTNHDSIDNPWAQARAPNRTPPSVPSSPLNRPTRPRRLRRGTQERLQGEAVVAACMCVYVPVCLSVCLSVCSFEFLTWLLYHQIAHIPFAIRVHILIVLWGHINVVQILLLFLLLYEHCCIYVFGSELKRVRPPSALRAALQPTGRARTRVT